MNLNQNIDLKIVMILNYYSHHQSELSEALYRETNGNYVFIETEPMEEERRNMGWAGIKLPSFVKQSYTSVEAKLECRKICDEADVVIIGSAPDSFIENRMKQNKLTFRYHERYFKEGRWRIFDPRVFISHYHKDFIYRNKNLYMLCAGAYTAPDCRFIHCYKNKTFKWGYFPKVVQYNNITDIMISKRTVSLLWVARFIKLKHPESPIYVAKQLKEEGYNFSMNLIGTGDMENQIKEMVCKLDLTDKVHFLGTMSPADVRKNMEESEIFLFTSDRNEGWGAVLNESMNSGCAIVANGAIGSVPYLIKDGENGLIYKKGDKNDLYKKVKYLIDNPEKRSQIGKKAYETIVNIWNADIAAQRLINLIEDIKNNKDPRYDYGPCGKDW